jgi:beta-galactosidase
MSLPWKSPIGHLIHGADYYPEQWSPQDWRRDVELMQKAGLTAVCLGVFAWSHLEPEENHYRFEWLDEIIGLLKKGGVQIILATPSGARPPWLSQKYPEVLRVDELGIRNLAGGRHNHCLTSPVYREKVAAMNERLAARYGADEAMVLWHVSNEYSGECHCRLCQEAFRAWLQRRYGTLDALNASWWGSFWSHRYSDWSQIEPPSKRGEQRLHGLQLAWRRFITDQTISFFKEEVAALRRQDRRTPVTTNFMGFFEGLDYGRFSRELDVVSVDVYPAWHRVNGALAGVAIEAAMIYDLCRSFKQQPFLLMESTPSLANWHQVNKLKRPGMHALASLQAVAHGSDSVQYFQWRKSRGSFEKFHGAVVAHGAREDARVFQEVARLSLTMQKLGGVAGGRVPAQAAVIHDWENRWAFDQCSGFRNDRKSFLEEIGKYYAALWRQSIPCDCIGSDADFSPYRVLIAPTLYMLKPGTAGRLEAFVRNGGTLILTCLSGWVDEEDLVFEDGQPGPLRSLLGLWIEEADALYDGERVGIEPIPTDTPLVPGGNAIEICERIHLETATPLARYTSEFYAGEPCLSVNTFGKGEAYYVAFRAESDYVGALTRGIFAKAGLVSVWPVPLPDGVNAQKRVAGETEFIFLMNFNDHAASISTARDKWIDAVTGIPAPETIPLSAFGVLVLRSR